MEMIMRLTPVTFKGKSYPSLKSCWEDVGKVPYGTTRTRLHRTRAYGTSRREDILAYALGHGPSPNTYDNPTNSKPVILPDGTVFGSIKEMCEHLKISRKTVYCYQVNTA